MKLYLDHPEALWLLLIALPIGYLGAHSLVTTQSVTRWTVTALRLLLTGLLVLLLADPFSLRYHDGLTVVAVIDQSESIRRFARPPASADTPAAAGSIHQWLRGWLTRHAADRRPDDRLGLVTYDGRPTVRSLPAAAVNLDQSTTESPTEGTDTASAIRLGMALFPMDTGKRLLLISDGNETLDRQSTGFDTGGAPGHSEVSWADLSRAAQEAKAAGIPIDVLPIEYRLDHEVMVTGVHAPVSARRHQTVPVRVVLEATTPYAGELHLTHDEIPIDLNGPAEGDGAPISRAEWTPAAARDETDASQTNPSRYLCVRRIEVPLDYSGVNQFVAFFVPNADEDDHLAVNNRAESFTFVHGRREVLLVSDDAPDTDSALADALTERGIRLDRVGSHKLPHSLAGLKRYDAVILENIPSERVSRAQQRLLAGYVRDLGAGLVMVGGPDSYGAGGWANTPLEEVLPVRCELPDRTMLPSGALVLILDRSGSMATQVTGSIFSKLDLANEAAVLAVATLFSHDLVGVVAFDGSPQWVVQLTPNQDPNAIAERIRSITPQGGTNIYPALDMAYHALAGLTDQQAAVKHAVLLTDGQSQDSRYGDLINKMVDAGITLSTIGVGDDVNQELLASLAAMGGGSYHPIDDPTNLPQVFIKEARTIRRNLIREGTFQPTLVHTGSPIMTGIDGLPPLRGFVRTAAAPDARVYTPILGPEDEPLFAHWQIGLGRVAAFTSDATSRWAGAWLQWPGYADFWARTVREVATPPVSENDELIVSDHGERLLIQLDTAPATGQPARGDPGVTAVVLTPDGQTQSVRLEQIGPGSFQANIAAEQPGNYIVTAFHNAPGRPGQRRTVVGGTTRPGSVELRHFRSNGERLEQVARITGGRVLDPAAEDTANLFDKSGVPASRSMRPLWQALLPWLIALLWLDVAARRVAWSPEAVRGWIKAQQRAIRGLARPRSKSAVATLDALKKRAAELNDNTDRSTPPEPRRPAADAPPPLPKATPPRQAAPNPARGAPNDTTSAGDRLRAAKERARKRFEEDEH